jgi:hypothetical protein
MASLFDLLVELHAARIKVARKAVAKPTVELWERGKREGVIRFLGFIFCFHKTVNSGV